MSQKVRIVKVEVVGAAPFLGLDRLGRPEWSRSGDRVMGWLASGWRFRYNEYRSLRHKWAHGPADSAPDDVECELANPDCRDGNCSCEPGAHAQAEHRWLVPIGDRVAETTTIKQARTLQPWLAAIPALVLHTAERSENTEWFAATKRRATLRSKGKPPGRMPRFKSFKRNGEQFTVFHNKGANARFHQTGKRRGILAIGGQNPAEWRKPGDGASWKVNIHVRVSEPIRPYTSVHVDWTHREAVFANAPEPRHERPAKVAEAVGVDVGAVHLAATSDGQVFDLPRETVREYDQKIRSLQRRQSKAKNVWAKQTGRDVREYVKSASYTAREQQLRDLHASAAAAIRDAQRAAALHIVLGTDVVVIEQLDHASLRGTPNSKPDPLRPGKFLPNGRTAKRGLNRTLARAAMGQFHELLRHYGTLYGTEIVEVPAKYTSQRCHACGLVDARNRESQAVFRCIGCGHEANADDNAARNILWIYLHNRGRAISPPALEAAT